jgi:hypothetical protein
MVMTVAETLFYVRYIQPEAEEISEIHHAYNTTQHNQMAAL